MSKHRPHDSLFKFVFQIPKEMRCFLTHFVSDYTGLMDLRTLKRDTTTYIDEDLKNYYSDVVYNCKTRKGKLKIAVLLEHKSGLAKHPHHQLLQYAQGIWNEDYRHQPKGKEPDTLTFVLPIVLYHGNKKWKKRPFSNSFHLPQPNLAQFVPHFNYILIDLSEYEDSFILNIEKSFLINTLLAFKHKNDTNYIRSNFKKLFTNAEEYVKNLSGRNFFRTFISYILNTTKVKGIEIKNLMEEIPILKSEVMTAYEDILLEGKKEGIEKVITGILKKLPNLSDQAIADIAEVDTEIVVRIRAKINT